MSMRSHAGSIAIKVRLAAFLAGLAGAVAILAALVSTAEGHLTHQSALATIGGACLLIVLAFAAVRPFDPLRH